MRRFRRGVTATLTPSEPAAFDLSLRAPTRRVTLARAFDEVLAERSLVRAGVTRKVTLKPRRAALRRAHRLTARLDVFATDAAGNRRRLTRRISVR